MISVNTNTGSLYARQAMSLSNRGYAAVMEQLSTGKQLNRSSDNVAGMAISTGMASQIKSLNQAVRNANDANSLLATADNALVQISSVLQRMRELSVQSVNSSLNTQDRNSLDFEFQQLKTQFGKVSSTTQWNGIDVLNGVIGSDWDGKFNFQVGSNSDQTIGVQILNLEQTPAIDVTGGNNRNKLFVFNSGVTPWVPTNFNPNNPSSYDSNDSGWNSATDDPFASTFAAVGFDKAIPQHIGNVLGSKLSLKINGVEAASAVIGQAEVAAIGGAIQNVYWDPRATPSPGDVKIYPAGTELSTTMIAKLKAALGNKAFDGGFLTVDDSNPHVLSVGFGNTRDGGATGPGTDSTTRDDNFSVSFGGVNGWAKVQVDPEQRFDLSVLDLKNETSATAQDQFNRVINAHFGNGSDTADASYTVTQADINAVDGGTKLSETVANWFASHLTGTGIQTDSSHEKGVLTVNWANPSSGGTTASLRAEASLPLSTAVITTSQDASNALGNVDSAIDLLNLQRAKIGVAMSAIQARSENLGAMSVNLQQSRSHIEDTEYGQATSELLKQNIIQQAASAMLAQANQSPDLVLLLLKSGSRN